MLQIFTNIITITDSMKPVADGIGAHRVYWLQLRARTNGFKIANHLDSIDGYTVAESGTITLPPIGMELQGKMFGLDDLYWANSSAGSNAVIELIGMREV